MLLRCCLTLERVSDYDVIGRNQKRGKVILSPFYVSFHQNQRKPRGLILPTGQINA